MATSDPRSAEFRALELRDDGRYVVVCQKGHKSITLLQQQRYEILYEIGAHAILDGYYREAVSSFVAALERFCEFAMRILLEARFGDDDKFKSLWPVLRSQSERQLGAYAALWIHQFGILPALLNTRNREFRNEVVHKGKLPTREEAIEFGEAVLDILCVQLKIIRGQLSEAATKVVFYHLRDLSRMDGVEVPTATSGVITLVGTLGGTGVDPPKTLSQYLPALQTQRMQFMDLFSRMQP